MRPSRSLGQAAIALLSLSSLASAGSWPRWLPELDSLVVRDAATSSSASSISQTSSPTAPTSNTASDSASSTNSNSASDTSSGTGPITTANLNTGKVETGSTSGSQTGNVTTHTSFNPEDPVGGITMITPAATLGTQLYKIGEPVTWVWNYTNLQANPSAIDVLVSCSTATETWTLTQNMSFAPIGSFTWDTGAYQHTAVASPLLTEEYTLIIYDADSSISATGEAGYLSAFDGFEFGMYTPQPYTPLASGWVCATCNAGVSDMDRRAIGFVLTMSIVTVLSFTWFVTGLGVM